jgi:hypothetical protein
MKPFNCRFSKPRLSLFLKVFFVFFTFYFLCFLHYLHRLSLVRQHQVKVKVKRTSEKRITNKWEKKNQKAKTFFSFWKSLTYKWRILSFFMKKFAPIFSQIHWWSLKLFSCSCVCFYFHLSLLNLTLKTFSLNTWYLELLNQWTFFRLDNIILTIKN